MLFNSYFFIAIFLPLTLLSYYYIAPLLNFRSLSKHQCRLFVLLIASLIFYGYWNPIYLVLIGVSILFNFFIGLKIHSLIKPLEKKTLLFLGIFFNLALLAYFKYANFFVENLEIFFNKSIEWEEILLPIAISFFTFQQIAYLVDVYNNKTHNYKLLNYSIFISFFPQLIAGPIVYHNEVKEQYANNKIADKFSTNILLGISIFTLGLFKKVIIADTLANFVDPIFGVSEIGDKIFFLEAWVGIFAYVFQLYFDFSGYSDMAVGLARLFGIKLPFNFNSPFKAKNIIDFWQRWHITLSRFINEYLLTNLAVKFTRLAIFHNLTNFNFLLSIVLPVIITFSLSGLWHGASWNFLLWGLLHGFYIIIYYIWSELLSRLGIQEIKNKFFKFFSIILTFLAVTLSFVPFRAIDFESAMLIYTSLIPNELHSNHILSDFGTNLILFYIVMCFVVVWFFRNSNDFIRIDKKSLNFVFLNNTIFDYKLIHTFFSYILFIIFFSIIFILVSVEGIDTTPYIYFQF